MAILIDATVVRAVLLRATMKLGRAQLVPAEVLGWVPRVSREPAAEPTRA